MIAEVVRDTGWTWEQALDEITAPRLEALRRSWRRAPPVHRMVASFAGYKEPVDVENSSVLIRTPEDARRHFAMTGGKVPGVGHG